MKKLNLHQLKKLHALSTHELQCIKGGKKNNKPTGAGCPPPIN